MLPVVSAVLVTLCVAVCAPAQAQTLAVFTRASGATDSAVAHAAEQELQRLFIPASIHTVWKTRQASTDRFEQLVVSSFTGDCSVSERPVRRVVSKQATILGATPVQAQGRVLPFFTVDCDHLIQTLSPTFSYLSMPLRQSVLGRALGRVMAHEIYHILAETKDHSESGIAKPSFSREDLMAEQFAFDASSLQRIRLTANAASFHRGN